MEEGFINYTAELVAKHLGLDVIPTFARWNKYGGHATDSYYNRKNVFTLPLWLKNENKMYQTAYIAHEVAHFADKYAWSRGGHSPRFYEAEREALALFDLEPVYPVGERYLDTLLIKGTNVAVWTKSTAKTKLRRTKMRYGESRY